MELPVFLIHYQAPHWLLDAVRSVAASTCIKPVIVVIDNGGAPSSLRDEGVMCVSVGTNSGYTGGANIALDVWADRFPSSSFAVVASHDLLVEADCMHELMKAVQGDDSIGIAGPVLQASPRSTGGYWRAFRRRQQFNPQRASAPKPVESDWVSGTCLLLRRSCIDEVGRFDEELGSYLEDVDVCLRARDVGWRVAVVPSARACGIGSIAEASERRIAVNRLRLFVKRDGRPGLVLGVAESVVRVVRLAVRAIRSDGDVRLEAMSEVRGLVYSWRVVPSLLRTGKRGKLM